MNEDNEKKCYGVATNFIRKLTGFVEKNLQTFP